MPKTRRRKPRLGPIGRALRDAILNSGVSVYRVAVDSKVEPGTLSRFLAGTMPGGPRLETIEKLAQYLGLELRKGG